MREPYRRITVEKGMSTVFDASKEAYLGTLYDVILGYIDPNRFITMEKSAIALKNDKRNRTVYP